MLGKLCLGICFMLLISACKVTQHPELIVYNAVVYTGDTLYAGDAVAVRDGKITDIGTWADLQSSLGSDTKAIDAGGHFLMPGFIEGHGHYSGLGYSLINLNFLTSGSWEEIVEKVKVRTKSVPQGDWIVGRGWHQEKWDSIPVLNVQHYPYHYRLSEVSPHHPVVLYHASGHALFANQKAMELAGISLETPDPAGGRIVRDVNGKAIGVFEERAMKMVQDAYNSYLKTLDQRRLDSVWQEAIFLAESECLSKGITSFQDAGSTFDELRRYEKLANSGKLKVRLYVMAREKADELVGQVGKYRRIDVGNRFYTCRSIKSEVDGALGAFGAWLLQPYSDKPGFYGQNTTDIYDVKKIADAAIREDMQFCVHAIGDRANRVVLDVYEGLMDQYGEKDDLRWRIEHAQHLDTADIPRFARRKIIASMQGIHCTSDAPFVVSRLGQTRSRLGAYAWRSLLDNGVIIANGTDAPVEDVDPLKSFFASVTRRREDSGLVFFAEQKMTREEALRSYTAGNAFAAFEESWKGTLTPGKVADMVLLSNDLRTCSDDDILKTKVLLTITDGKIRYDRNRPK
ncbi:MAG: amidohydrolase [Saprospiraceae bacterium]|nr:amidohydrolase [Saprospiraceae bacterium]